MFIKISGGIHGSGLCYAQSVLEHRFKGWRITTSNQRGRGSGLCRLWGGWSSNRCLCKKVISASYRSCWSKTHVHVQKRTICFVLLSWFCDTEDIYFMEVTLKARISDRQHGIPLSLYLWVKIELRYKVFKRRKVLRKFYESKTEVPRDVRNNSKFRK